MSSVFGGSMTANPDGSINFPADSTYLYDIAFACNFSATSYVTFELYNCDTDQVYTSVNSASANYNSPNDWMEIRSAQIVTGESPIRIGIRVRTKQSSGTCTIQRYNSFIKLVEV